MNPSTKNLVIKFAIIVIGIIVIVGPLSFITLLRESIENAPEHYEVLGIEDLDEIAPYEVCIPAYLPTGIDPNPIFKYIDVWPDNKTYMEFGFRGIDTNKELIGMIQDYHPDRSVISTKLSSLKKALLVWLVGWEEIDGVENQVQIQTSEQDLNGITTTMIEIIEPASLRSTVIKWSSNDVDYTLFSLFEPNETMLIVESFCNTQ